MERHPKCDRYRKIKKKKSKKKKGEIKVQIEKGNNSQNRIWKVNERGKKPIPKTTI
jgi:hypothetical protein